MAAKKSSVAVVVDRFQTYSLTGLERISLEDLEKQHEELAFVIRQSRAVPNKRDPLSFEERKRVLETWFMWRLFLSLTDRRFDADWSKALDELLEKQFPEKEIHLYLAEDSPAYSGKYPHSSIGVMSKDSVSRLRLMGGFYPEAFRSGTMYAYALRPPIQHRTVDAAILRNREVLLGRKRTDDPTKLRFIGGFVDFEDPSDEHAVTREVAEETGGIITSSFTYIGSMKVDDWRYRGTGDCIKTTLFMTLYISGKPVPSDDIAHLEWVPLSLLCERLVEEHEPLGRMLLTRLSSEK